MRPHQVRTHDVIQKLELGLVDPPAVVPVFQKLFEIAIVEPHDFHCFVFVLFLFVVVVVVLLVLPPCFSLGVPPPRKANLFLVVCVLAQHDLCALACAGPVAHLSPS